MIKTIKGKKYIICGYCKNPYPLGALRYKECPHPAVRAKRGKYMCVYCCTKCKHFRLEPPTLGVRHRICYYHEDVKKGGEIYINT